MASRDHIKVMVVDDEATVAKTVQLILETEGFKVRVFDSPKKALVAAKKTAYQLAIVDIKMPIYPVLSKHPTGCLKSTKIAIF